MQDALNEDQRNWTLKVSNLGRIREAEIELSPFVLLVGRNNTGKSYIASTIWGLHDAYDVLVEAGFPKPRWYEEFCKKVFSNSDGGSLTVSTRQAQSVVNLFNKILGNSDSYLAKLFRFDGFSGASMKVEPKEVRGGYKVSFSKFTVQTGSEAEQRINATLTGPSGYQLLSLTYAEADVGTPDFLNRYLFSALVASILYGGESPTLDALYVPAARTGLVLAQKALGGTSLGLFDQPIVTLPQPISNFMQRLTRPRYDIGVAETSKIADWLEREILKGTVLRDDQDKSKFYYQPANEKLQVPLHATSSMITELAPFLVMLRKDVSTDLIIFEEPEAHLHLAAQRAMARALVRLMNSGRRVVVTTHSDTFVQQINNLIQLHGHPNRAQLLEDLGYTEDDLLDPHKCRAYEFFDVRGRSAVTPVPLQVEGFAVGSLNDTLFSLSKETLRIQEGETR